MDTYRDLEQAVFFFYFETRKNLNIAKIDLRKVFTNLRKSGTDGMDLMNIITCLLYKDQI